MNNKNKAAAGTFVLNKDVAIHRWYSYIEGYSSYLIDSLFEEVGKNKIKSVYDPFGGTGTTALVAAQNGIKSYYSETNPFMRSVIEAKVNAVQNLKQSGEGSKPLRLLLKKINNYKYEKRTEEVEWDGFEKYFDNDVLYKILDIKGIIKRIKNNDARIISEVLLSSILVKVSNMTRQGDLRFAKEGELKKKNKDVVKAFSQKIKEAIEDIDDATFKKHIKTECVCENAKELSVRNKFDCVITSPPYLNGTNYIRNTKLELKLSDNVCSEKDLALLHSKGIIAGINSVSKRNDNFEIPQEVEPYVDELNKVAYDKRIPIMVAGYFSDMEKFIDKLSIAVKNHGIFIMDIGDSQFAGVHIPTHEILIKICNKYGFSLYDEEVIRERRSKNGMKLSQRLLKFKLRKHNTSKKKFRDEAKQFIKELPYQKEPFSKRNWGHPWHSLCSYHGKLKPSIAHFMVKSFTEKGDVVLDPLCGVGTIPLEACLQGRIGLGNDLSELAYTVTKAKIEKADYNSCLRTLNELKNYINRNKNRQFIKDDIKKYKSFGFNGKLLDYYHNDTFKEIICARRFFLKRIKKLSSSEAMVFACLLHILHGNRPYALSRRSHPLTPYSPKGNYEYKNVVEHINRKLLLSYSKEGFEKYLKGMAIYGDYNRIELKGCYADVIICSPPFANSIRFYMQNWLRLWMCGWEKEDYKNADSRFLDQLQNENFDIYYSFFEKCASLLKPGGKLILHLGKTEKADMAYELATRSREWFEEVYRGFENVKRIEKHGIKDKGGTFEHQFLFLQKK